MFWFFKHIFVTTKTDEYRCVPNFEQFKMSGVHFLNIAEML